MRTKRALRIVEALIENEEKIDGSGKMYEESKSTR